VSVLKLVDTTQLAFDYDRVDATAATEARQAAERIKLRLRRSAEDIIAIGLDLIAVKESIGHGNFLPWIEAEFGMSANTARNFMRVGETYAGKSANVAHLDATALYELAAPKTPIEVREEVEKMIEAGEVVTKATVVDLRNKLSGLEKAKSLAESEIDEKDARINELSASMNETVAAEIDKAARRIAKEHAEEIARLTSQVQMLSRPKVVEISDGKVVPLRRDLTESEKAEIDAEGDDMAGDIVDSSSPDRERAAVVVGSLRSISRMKADPASIYSLLVDGYSKQTVSEHIAMLGAAISLLQSVKEKHND